MREIKFRGLDKKGIWHYGYYWMSPDGECYIKERIAKTHSADFRVRPETVGQYTGLKDKNGKEIYEGDIISYRSKSDFQIYQEKVFWNIDGWVCGGIHLRYATFDESEIIGNIYENPELLKEV